MLSNSCNHINDRFIRNAANTSNIDTDDDGVDCGCSVKIENIAHILFFSPTSPTTKNTTGNNIRKTMRTASQHHLLIGTHDGKLSKIDVGKFFMPFVFFSLVLV